MELKEKIRKIHIKGETSTINGVWIKFKGEKYIIEYNYLVEIRDKNILENC